MQLVCVTYSINNMGFPDFASVEPDLLRIDTIVKHIATFYLIVVMASMRNNSNQLSQCQMRKINFAFNMAE